MLTSFLKCDIDWITKFQDAFESFFSGTTFPSSFPAMETPRLTESDHPVFRHTPIPIKFCSGRVFRATRGSTGIQPTTSTWSTGPIPFSQSSSTSHSHFTLYQFPEINYLCIFSTAQVELGWASEWYFEPDIDIKQCLIELCKNALSSEYSSGSANRQQYISSGGNNLHCHRNSNLYWHF